MDPKVSTNPQSLLARVRICADSSFELSYAGDLTSAWVMICRGWLLVAEYLDPPAPTWNTLLQYAMSRRGNSRFYEYIQDVTAVAGVISAGSPTPLQSKFTALEHAVELGFWAETLDAAKLPFSSKRMFLGAAICVGMVSTLWRFREAEIVEPVFEQESPWILSIYPNTELAEPPNFTGWAREIDHDWTVSGPFVGAATDRYTARWVSCMRLTTATRVRFRAGADDGIRVVFADRAIIESWREGGYLETAQTLTIPPGLHRIAVEYLQLGGSAVVRFSADGTDGLPLEGIFYRPLSTDSKAPACL